MTGQIPDNVRYRRCRYAIIAVDGRDLFDPTEQGITPGPLSTACWRGYICTYLIRRNRLTLEAVEIGRPEDHALSAELFGVTPSTAEADALHAGAQRYRGLAAPVAFSGRPLLGAERGRKHADDLRRVVDAMLYIAQTGCQWRYLPESFGPWTLVWSQFRRWTRNGIWARALTVLHTAAREADGRAEETPSMVVIDTHLARGASNGGFTFHDRGGPYGRTKSAKRASRPST